MGIPNIYSVELFKMKPKVRAYIDKLKGEGQIDLDEHGYPYVMKIEPQGSNTMVHVVRNGVAESFLMNTRSKAAPVESWDRNDGYRRKAGGKTVISATQAGPKAERERRTIESFERIVDQILES